MQQMTLTSAKFDRYGKTMQRAEFLVEMEQMVP